MSNAECIITGCAFLDQDGQRWIWGDLHLMGDILILNASGCDWSQGPMRETDKALTSSMFYYKNHVVVVPLAVAQFNVHANAYLNETMPEAPRIVTLQ